MLGPRKYSTKKPMAHTVDGSEIRRENQLRKRSFFSAEFYQGILYVPGGVKSENVGELQAFRERGRTSGI